MQVPFRVILPVLLTALALAGEGCASRPRNPVRPPARPGSTVPGSARGTATPTDARRTESAGPAVPRRFDFPRDTVGFTNETRWIYRPSPDGGMTHEPRNPPPTYSLRCFVVARLNRQFFDHAEFLPDQPKPDPTRLRALVRAVIRRSTRHSSADSRRVRIPGYRDLRELSEDQAPLLKELAGGASLSYLQRGHWRMILPFSRRHQAREAERIFARVATGRPALVHLVRFPQLTLNHAVLVFGARRTGDGLEFDTADPNDPGRSRTLRFDPRECHFLWPQNAYFAGGRVDAYEVFRNLCY